MQCSKKELYYSITFGDRERRLAARQL